MDINANSCLLSCKLYRDIQAYVACIAALERQGLACNYLAHCELNSVLIISIIIVIIVAAIAMH